jgi:hypothetical protein
MPTSWIRRAAAALAAVLVLAASEATAGPARVTEPLQALAADAEVVAWIGAQIRRNETGGQPERLIWWAPGEDHASLGIGHVIWYPAGRRGPYHESFLDLLTFLDRQGVTLPAWLDPARDPAPPCPWPDRAAFLAAAADPRMVELRELLAATVPEQTAYLLERLRLALPAMLAMAAEPGRIEGRLARLLRAPDGAPSPEGLYALVDYVNFKGEGTAPGERYQDEGWGLLQVLETMADRPGEARTAFAQAADAVLTRRVALAPAGRDETRWLAGWRVRIATYRGARFERRTRPA